MMDAIKIYWLATVMMLGFAGQGLAVEMRVDVTYPAISVEGAGDIALWVEDGRGRMVIGLNGDDESLVASKDIAASLYAQVASNLKQAGFHLVPYTADSHRGLLLKIVSLTFKAEKSMVKTSAQVKATISVTMGGLDTTYTYHTSVSDEFAWKPSADKIGALIGEALVNAMQAAFSEPAIAAKLAAAN